jgi:hypothetical protein
MGVIKLADQTEIERLRAENEDLRCWKAMDKPLTAAMAVVNSDVQRLRAQLTEAAAFLDGLANKLDGWSTYHAETEFAATDCRAMAKKLREAK